MVCGCADKLNADNKRLGNAIQLNNDKILRLDSMVSMSIDDIVDMYRKGYRLEEKSIENNDYINSLTQTAASKTGYTSGSPTTTVQAAPSTSAMATWHLYYTTNPCGSGHSSSLSYTKNGGALINDYTIVVPCGVDYNAYVIETFINYLMQHYGLLDADTIYVKDVLYTKRWICTTTTGICSQIDGSGYASKAKCTGIWPCNPNQWKIAGENGLTGTVTVSGNILAWSVIPKGATQAITFNFGDHNYIPIVYTDTAWVDQIGVYIPTANTYAINTSYHGGNADTYVPNSYAITTISNVAGFVKQISFSVGSATITSTPTGARIYIDDIDSHYITPITIQNITQGDHIYKLVLTGYNDSTGNFTITAGATTTVPAVTLVQRVGTLKFFSTPSGATISIGGVSKGTTTVSGLIVPSLPIGLTSYIITLTGYDTYNGTETVIEDVTTDVTVILTATTSGKGSLFIETTPPCAEIFIDGVDKLLATPYTFTGMDIGSHTYGLTLPGYNTTSGIFTITANNTTTITKALQSAGGGESGGGGMIFGLIGVVALGMMMSSKSATKEAPTGGKVERITVLP